MPAAYGNVILPALPRLPEHGPLLGGLALTRVIGWGSTYYAPSVLIGYLAAKWA